MLELISANSALVAALVFGGALVGGLVAWIALPSQKLVRTLERELDESRKQHSEYRDDVTDHFKKTAELVGEMTKSYKAVYDHLANGAQSFCVEQDALTSEVFGSPRIIHDPQVAIGAVPGQAGAQPEASAAKPAAEQLGENPSDKEEVSDSPAADAAGTEKPAGT